MPLNKGNLFCCDLEPRSPKPRYCQDHTLTEGYREKFTTSLSLILWWLLATLGIPWLVIAASWSLCPSSHGLPLCVCVCAHLYSDFSFFLRILVIGLGSTLLQCELILTWAHQRRLHVQIRSHPVSGWPWVRVAGTQYSSRPWLCCLLLRAGWGCPGQVQGLPPLLIWGWRSPLLGKERRFFLMPFALHLPSFLVTQRVCTEPWHFDG